MQIILNNPQICLALSPLEVGTATGVTGAVGSGAAGTDGDGTGARVLLKTGEGGIGAMGLV